ncbi:3-phosphoshikimate 1-carboxyvinyltransferase [Asticcacaulis biprosthecium C19]|uniref:3-phosphoshikimate 1-carboxyvinyltransferase n=1 Tax=Asticcacaulis biprosthecium C19 TaxID=715226 RepID=F4QIN3_9CAUL|nr:3-phosphoshikimate 1-carboxyvinyltransferase [Asticcacaulis biprosthecium]EGF91792.1 3-phosphoshikimate 1-carboxyvinyltransferase [Asticcacaulis biprosthecium C19]
MIPDSPKAVKLVPVSKTLSGRIALPGSKSITNRVLLIAALAQGSSRITGALKSDDTTYMARALEQLGVTVSDTGDTEFLVESTGTLTPSETPLFLGNAGTAVRFLTAAAANVAGTTVLTGDAHMQKRPIAPLVEALNAAGVTAQAPTGCPPVTVHGNGGFQTRAIEVDASLSSQYVSALMMAGTAGDAPFSLKVKDGDIGARGYIDITLTCMRDFGAQITQTGPLSWDIANRPYQARDYWVEPDASAATYVWGINALTGAHLDIGIAPEAMMQPDAKAYDFIRQFPNLPAVIDGSQMQDAIPTIAVLAAFNHHPVRFVGIANLRVKECDRINAVATELNRIQPGLAQEIGDDLLITPDRSLIGRTVEADIETYHDHRIAMAFAQAALVINGVRILDPGCTAKTYPGYWRDLQSVGVEMTFD